MSPVLAAVALVSYGVVLCCPSPSYTPKNPMRCLECPQGFSRATCTVSKASAEQCVGGVKMRKPHRYVRMSQEAAAAAASAPIAPSSAPRNSRCCAAGRGQTQRLWRGNGTPASLRTHRAGSTHGEPPGVPWHHGDSGERQPAAAEAGIQGRVLNPRDGKPAQPGEATQRPTGGGPRHGAPAALPSRAQHLPGPLRLPLRCRVNSRPENGGAAPRPLRGRGVVAGAFPGVWQGVPGPQQLRGQGQAQVNVGKDPSLDEPQGPRPQYRERGQPRGQTAAPVPGRLALVLPVGHGFGLGLREVARGAGLSPGRALLHPKLCPPPWPGQDECWCPAQPGEALPAPLPAQVAVRGRQPAEGGGAAAQAGQPQWVLPDPREPDQARLLLAVGAPQHAQLLGLGDALPHPPPGERLALHLAPAHVPQPARPGGALLRGPC
ncbi:src-like-adapter 2 isoform X5 [Cuculus canorus]|uniref:src-like-adapter 2 isoform X5 n=1 Tax=Cuculus canorus TaxID=55661 RepID=UPI0023AB328A|nr:src-like-adapter 2 isoform X5 [Cuculus canorus]